MNCSYIRFYNRIARDIFLKFFSKFYPNPHGQVELSKMLERARILRGEDGFILIYFCLAFFVRVQLFNFIREVIIKGFDLRPMNCGGSMQSFFDSPLKKIMDSCRDKLGKNHACLDYAYVDTSNKGWTLYLFKASVSMLPHRNKDLTQMELLFCSEP